MQNSVLFAFFNMYLLASGPVHRFHIPTGHWHFFCVSSVFIDCLFCGVTNVICGLVITLTFLCCCYCRYFFDFLGFVSPPFHYFVCFGPIPFTFFDLCTVNVVLYIFTILPMIVIEIFLDCLVTKSTNCFVSYLRCLVWYHFMQFSFNFAVLLLP